MMFLSSEKALGIPSYPYLSFLDLLLFRDPANNTLQYSTFQKPLNKYLYIPYESFHPASNKKAFIKGELMCYARNSLTFRSFDDTHQLFWKRLRLRGYPARFLLPVFREIIKTIVTGINVSLSLGSYLDIGQWCSNPRIIAVMLESKKLFLSICRTLALFLVINLPIC